jgi:hypothetical protein
MNTGLPVGNVSKLTNRQVAEHSEALSGFPEPALSGEPGVADTLWLQRARYKKGQRCQGQWWSAHRVGLGVALVSGLRSAAVT